MRPYVTHITYRESGGWINFQSHLNSGTLNRAAYALRFSDGSEWDCTNGWRQETLPTKEDPTIWEGLMTYERAVAILNFLYARLLKQHKENSNYDYMLGLKEVIQWISAQVHHGPTTPTSTPTPQASESPSPTVGGSSTLPEGPLWEALNLLKSLPTSYGWSLSVVSAQSNTTFEANRPTAATDSAKLPPDHRWNSGVLERFSEAMQQWVRA